MDILTRSDLTLSQGDSACGVVFDQEDQVAAFLRRFRRRFGLRLLVCFCRPRLDRANCYRASMPLIVARIAIIVSLVLPAGGADHCCCRRSGRCCCRSSVAVAAAVVAAAAAPASALQLAPASALQSAPSVGSAVGSGSRVCRRVFLFGSSGSSSSCSSSSLHFGQCQLVRTSSRVSVASSNGRIAIGRYLSRQGKCDQKPEEDEHKDGAGFAQTDGERRILLDTSGHEWLPRV